MSEDTALSTTLHNVHLENTETTDAELDPWKDTPAPEERVIPSDKALLIPESDLRTIQGPPVEPGETTGHTAAVADILLEFDPLASAEESAAQNAWSSSAGHPPPPAPINVEGDVPPSSPDPAPSPPHTPSPPNRASSPIPTFPALAALARTFALPLTSRGQRPRSIDTATAVPSPATISSFAKQQDALPPRRPQDISPSGAQDAVASSSGRSTPSGKGKELEPPTFDFQKFLDQMKAKGAEPVAKYLRSFLSNFAKRTFTVNDQVKLINDFLNFISARMRDSDVWRNATEAEFDNAMEGMEKLVMNRLYEFTFTPQVAKAIPPRPVTADDLERDRVLSQRIALFKWIEPKHLDVPEGEGSEGFLMFAQQELLKINHYKAPRDKLICILNCCKVIFGLIRHLRKDESADTFVPILIYTVLKANPPHLLSNVEFINRFRNPAKLQSEAGYYLSSLMGAVSFVETMDHTSLSHISQEEFERNVEDAIQSLPSTGSQTPERAFTSGSEFSGTTTPPRFAGASASHTGEESAQPLSLPTPGQTLGEDARRFLQKTGDTISKPLNAISRIFNEVLDGAEDTLSYLPGPFAPLELGREQQEQQLYAQDGHSAYPQGYPQTPMGPGAEAQQYQPPLQPPYKPRVRRVSPQPSPQGSIRSASSAQFPLLPPDDTPTRARSHSLGPHTNQALAIGPSQQPGAPQPARLHALVQGDRELHAPSPHVSRTPTPALDIAGLQQEIDRAHEKAAVAARETLRQIFPTTDAEIVEWVLEANEGDLGKSIEALLEMSSGT
ncbi:guanine nucleotide exchange factor VPS9 [Trametes versicolor FP-101664 SS1]|uniref:guanine nucleotide exchange factor VPS9 n=1 Tax=Trametes versicolor (strain FP-101664) TaxID=717944 RepID=UPI0004622E81|nr:guanine nucleotide exchange factor VPS9 [Trametes versicolor FP-101664 SS1]EIW58590.1 hypothetical protein TRAVEDRAFT_58773 [Trametes versicolor FP-101664 SS1]